MTALRHVLSLVVAVWTFGVSLSMAQAPALADLRPVTADDSCEFGYLLTTNEVWESSVVQRRSDQLINFALQKAVQYCKNGDILVVGRDGSFARGYVHDYFSIAARLCRRQEILEVRHPLIRASQQEAIDFRCQIKKIDDLKAKAARGEPLFKWPDDFVDPRPGDDVPRPTAPRQAFVPPAKAASSDCKDPTAALYAERCGISIMAPAK